MIFAVFPGSLVLEPQGMLGSVSGAGTERSLSHSSWPQHIRAELVTLAGVSFPGHGESPLLLLHAGAGILPLLTPADLCGRQEEGEDLQVTLDVGA